MFKNRWKGKISDTLDSPRNLGQDNVYYSTFFLIFVMNLFLKMCILADNYAINNYKRETVVYKNVEKYTLMNPESTLTLKQFI